MPRGEISPEGAIKKIDGQIKKYELKIEELKKQKVESEKQIKAKTINKIQEMLNNDETSFDDLKEFVNSL